MVGGMGVLCLVAAPASSLFIPLVFGTAFKPAVLPFQELLVATFLATVHQACQPALLARSHRIGIVLPPVAGATLTLSLTYVLVPAFGMQGAVLGTICGFAVLAGLSLLFAGARKAHPDQA